MVSLSLRPRSLILPIGLFALLAVVLMIAEPTALWRSQAIPASCGNGTIDAGETCMEPGLGTCPASQECLQCRCQAPNTNFRCGNTYGRTGGCTRAGQLCIVGCLSGNRVLTGRCDARMNCYGYCGDGKVDSGEQCDTGNTESEACTEACIIRSGWNCTGSPSSCTRTAAAASASAAAASIALANRPDIVLDNSDRGFMSYLGSWSTDTVGHRGSQHVHSSGPQDWNRPLEWGGWSVTRVPEGDYGIYATWEPDSGFSRQVTLEIDRSFGLLSTPTEDARYTRATINQQSGPAASWTCNGRKWQYFGNLHIAADANYVGVFLYAENGAPRNSRFAIDAVMLAPTNRSPVCSDASSSAVSSSIASSSSSFPMHRDCPSPYGFVAVPLNVPCPTYSSSSSSPATAFMPWARVGDMRVGTRPLSGVATNGITFVAVGASGKGAYSTDGGLTWTAINDMRVGTSPLLSVTYGGGKFVAVGDAGRGAYSTDGITWTAINDMRVGTNPLVSVAYGNGRFVAVGNTGLGTYSTDGITWTAIADTKTYGEHLFDIAFGNGRFVAVGANGRGSHSTNGVTWTQISDLKVGTTFLNAVTFGNGRFVAVGEDNKGTYSADGMNWTAIPDLQVGTTPLQGIAFGNGRFVAVGASGAGAYSTDGRTWTRNVIGSLQQGFSENYLAVTYGAGKFLAVGDGGKGAYALFGSTQSSSIASPDCSCAGGYDSCVACFRTIPGASAEGRCAFLCSTSQFSSAPPPPPPACGNGIREGNEQCEVGLACPPINCFVAPCPQQICNLQNCSCSVPSCPASTPPACPGGVLFPQIGPDAYGCALPPVCCQGAASGGQCTTHMSCTSGRCIVDACTCTSSSPVPIEPRPDPGPVPGDSASLHPDIVYTGDVIPQPKLKLRVEGLTYSPVDTPYTLTVVVENTGDLFDKATEFTVSWIMSGPEVLSFPPTCKRSYPSGGISGYPVYFTCPVPAITPSTPDRRLSFPFTFRINRSKFTTNKSCIDPTSMIFELKPIVIRQQTPVGNILNHQIGRQKVPLLFTHKCEPEEGERPFTPGHKSSPEEYDCELCANVQCGSAQACFAGFDGGRTDGWAGCLSTVGMDPMRDEYAYTTDYVRNCSYQGPPQDPPYIPGVPIGPPTQTCGNGILEKPEWCDDGNNLQGDGCFKCLTQGGFSCTKVYGLKSVCTRTQCGNGKVDTGEQCDDANVVGNDGCSGDCKVESGFSCAVFKDRPSSCSRGTCGNGRWDLYEDCDDGNKNSGDGCSAACKYEAGWVCNKTPNPDVCTRSTSVPVPKVITY